MSEAGIIVLPPHHAVDGGESNEDVAKDQTGEVPVCKPGIPKSELFDPEDSWFDSPPDGFSLTVSLDLEIIPSLCFLSLSLTYLF